MATDEEQDRRFGAGGDRQWRTPSSVAIGSASFLADAGHEVPTSLLPSLLTSTLGAPAAALGVIEGVADALAGVARLAGGALADDPQRRVRSAVSGYTATAVLSSAIGAATSVAQVGVLRAGAWTARGLRVPARNALLADAVRPEYFGRAYGLERAMDNLGAITGPLLALGLVAVFGTRTAILLSVIPGLLAAAAVIYAVRRLPHAPRRARQPLRLRVRPVLATPLRRLAPGIAAFEVGNIAATLLILRATEALTPARGAQSATTLAIGLYVGYNAAAAVASLFAGRASDRHDSVAVLAAGAAMFGVAYLSLAFTGASLVILAGAFVAAGIAIGCVETAEHAAVATHVPEPVRGSAFGLLAAVQAFGNLIASSIAGLLWTAVSATAALLSPQRSWASPCSPCHEEQTNGPAVTRRERYTNDTGARLWTAVDCPTARPRRPRPRIATVQSCPRRRMRDGAVMGRTVVGMTVTAPVSLTTTAKVGGAHLA